MKRILVTGRNGQVGHELAHALAPVGDVVALDRVGLDLTRTALVREAVQALRPDIVVNAAAYTAVDRAETEPELARLVNAVAPGAMAEEAARIGALFVHYSTDYVFDGTKTTPYHEDDPTHPLGVYGRTKLEGEEAVRAAGGPHLILRTSWVYGQHGHNFLKTMLRLAGEGRGPLRVVADQHGSPTWSRTVAEATRDLLGAWHDGEDARSGTYHLSAEGATTWHGFAEAIFRLTGRAVEVVPLHTEDYPTPAPRPAYSVLSKAKLARTFGITLPAWDDALRDALGA